MKLIAVALLTFAIATPAYAFDGHDWGWTRPRAAVHQHHRYRHVHRVARLYRGSDNDIRHEDGRHSDEAAVTRGAASTTTRRWFQPSTPSPEMA